MRKISQGDLCNFVGVSKWVGFSCLWEWVSSHSKPTVGPGPVLNSVGWDFPRKRREEGTAWINGYICILANGTATYYLVPGSHPHHWILITYRAGLPELPPIALGPHQVSLFQATPGLSMEIRTAHWLLPVGNLEAATVFWRAGEFNSMGAGHFMSVSSSAKECSCPCLTYTRKHSNQGPFFCYKETLRQVLSSINEL